MYPASFVCKALTEIPRTQFRVGWKGDEVGGSSEKGCFALLQLYHKADVGDIADPKTLNELWFYGWRDRIAVNRRVDRGPIFKKDGSVGIDFDTEKYTPVVVFLFDGDSKGYDGLPTHWSDLKNGKAVKTVIANVNASLWKQLKKIDDTSVARKNTHLEDLGGQMTESMQYLGRTGDQSYHVTTRDQRIAAIKDDENAQKLFDGGKTVESRMSLPVIPNAFEDQLGK